MIPFRSISNMSLTIKIIGYFSSDLYKILGLNKHATQQQIKEQFISLAKIQHPDVSNNKHNNFKDITNAYNVLKDPMKKQIYDQGLSHHNHEQKPPQHYQYTQQYKTQERAYKRQYHETFRFQYAWIFFGGIIAITLIGLLLTQTNIQQRSRIVLQTNNQRVQQLNTNDPPMSYKQLLEIQNNLDAESLRFGVLQGQEQSKLRRQHIFRGQEYVDDMGFEVRKQNMEKEMKDKQFSIQYETWEKVNTGYSNILVPRSKNVNNHKKKRQRGTKQDDKCLEDYAKEHKLSLHKIDKIFHHAQQITIEQYQSSFVDDYM